MDLTDLIKQKEDIENMIKSIKQEEIRKNNRTIRIAREIGYKKDQKITDEMVVIDGPHYALEDRLKSASELIVYHERKQKAMEYLIKNKLEFHYTDDFITLAGKHRTTKIADSYTKNRLGKQSYCDCDEWASEGRCCCGNVRLYWRYDNIEFDEKNPIDKMDFRLCQG
jgi:hypothetical protein